MNKSKTVILTEEQLYRFINNEVDKQSTWLYHAVLGSHNTSFKDSANGDEFAALRYYGAIMPYDNGEIGIPVIWMTDDKRAYANTHEHPERIVIAVPYNERTKKKFDIFVDGNYFAKKPLPLDDEDVHIINAPAVCIKTDFGTFYYGCDRNIEELLNDIDSTIMKQINKIVFFKDILTNLSNISEKMLQLIKDKFNCNVEITNLLKPDDNSSKVRDNYMFYTTNDAKNAYDDEYQKPIPLEKELNLIKFNTEYNPLLVNCNKPINFFFLFYGSMYSNDRINEYKEEVKDMCLDELHNRFNYDYDDQIEEFFNNLNTTDYKYIVNFLNRIGVDYRKLAYENMQNKISEQIHFKGTSQDLYNQFGTCIIIPGDGSVTNTVNAEFNFNDWFTNKDKQLKQKN